MINANNGVEHAKRPPNRVCRATLVLGAFLSAVVLAGGTDSAGGRHEGPTFSTPQALLTEGTSSASSSVRDIATLRALTSTALPSSMNCDDGTGASGTACCIMVHGYVDHADGGGGVFCYKPHFGAGLLDDQGTVVKPNSVLQASAGRWLRTIPANTFDVR